MTEPDTLAGLLSHIRRQARARDAALAALGDAGGGYPHLAALEDFRRLWTRQRAREQLRAALQAPPADSGPLNSASLAHRALALMRATSPGYLQHLLAHLDALAWLEQLHDPAGPQPGAGKRRPARSGRPAGRRRKPAR